MFETYINKQKELYDNLILYLDSSEEYEKDFQDLHQMINDHIEGNKQNFQTFLQLITNIANNYHRDEIFKKKIFMILNHYSNQIKQTFSNSEIFDIFKSNKLILLFLFENKVINVDDNIYNEFISKTEECQNGYCYFFYPEIKEFAGEEKVKDIEKELLKLDKNIFNCFNEKRHEGENDSYICSLIRNDSIEDFIVYVNRESIPLTSEVKNSIFETNSFLIEKGNTSLIEYSCFYGSIQIFQFLLLNKVEPKPSIWLYSIHSKNAELIHLLESNDIEPPDCIDSDIQSDNELRFEICLCESIKCHHNDIAHYVEDNLLPVNSEARKRNEIVSCFMHFLNYSYFPLEFGDLEFFYSFYYNYDTLVNLYMSKNEGIIREITYNKNLLQEAVKNNKIDVIYYLLQNKEMKPKDFRRNNKLIRIVIPSSITSFGGNDFQLCTSLKQIIIPSSVKSIGEYAFQCCKSLLELTIHSPEISIGEYTFQCCDSLRQVTINSSKVLIGSSAFQCCKSLRKITINSDEASIGDYSFQCCPKLRQIEINSSNTSFGQYTFQCCGSLVQLTIPSSVKTIGDYTFECCKSLTQLIIPSSVSSIGKCAFQCCESLTKLIIHSPNLSIGCYAFQLCRALTQVSFPSSITLCENSTFPRDLLKNLKKKSECTPLQ